MKGAKFISYLTLIGALATCSLKAQSLQIDNIQATNSIIIRTDVNKYFKDCNVQGSTVIFDDSHKKWIFSDSTDANIQALPASSFKIINLLIALETGVVKDENEVIKWNGQMDTVRYGYRSDIYHDMTIQEAFRESAVWVFLDLAKKIGKTNYQYYLKACKYGNQNLSESGEDFWNFGFLKISPLNQVDFLRSMYAEKLPFSKRNIDIVKRVMITEQTEEYTIRAKTGWTREGGINTGWWVGYVENRQGVFFFATRIFQDRKYNSPDFGPCRKEITKSIFRDIGIIH